MAARDDTDKWLGEMIPALLAQSHDEREEFYQQDILSPEMVHAFRGLVHFYEGAKK